MTSLQLVWFKRDLRLRDHAALTAASSRGPVVGLVVYEPSLWSLPDASGRQAAFYQECLAEFKLSADKIGLRLLIVLNVNFMPSTRLEKLGGDVLMLLMRIACPAISERSSRP